MEILDYLTFEWDEKKNEINKSKHGLSFDTAKFIFLDPDYIDLFDEKHSTKDEERHIIIGLVEEVLFVVCVFQTDSIRIIPCRLATKEEEKFYYAHKANIKA